MQQPNLKLTELVSLFEYYSSEVTNIVLPQKTIIIQKRDKPYFTQGLKNLRRRKMREYSKSGKSAKFLSLQEEYKTLLKSEVKKYKEKLLSQVEDGSRGSIYKLLRRLGDSPGGYDSFSFNIASHIKQNLTSQQSAEKIQ